MFVCIKAKIKTWIDAYLAILGVDSGTNTVDLLVGHGTMMVTLLSSTCNGERDTTWMPSTDTSDFTQTLVCFAWQFLCVPTGCNTLETFTLGDSNGIDHFILGKDLAHWHWLFQMFANPVDFVFDASTVQLDFHNMCLLLALLDQTDLNGIK